MYDDRLFGSFLLDMGLVSRAQIETALAQARESGSTLSHILTSNGFLGEDEARRALGAFLGVPFARIDVKNIPPEILFLIPEPICRAHSLVALEVKEGALQVALLNLEDLAALEPLRLPYTLKPQLTDQASLRSALLRYQHLLKERFAVDVDGLLLRALAQGASEVHLEKQGENFLVRYRVAGRLRDAYTLPSQVALDIAGRLKRLGKLLPDTITPQEGRFKMLLDGEGGEVSVQIASIATIDGEALTLRLLPTNSQGHSLERLGLGGDGLEELHRALNARAGLVLVCGDAESGAEALLTAMLAHTAHPTRRLVVISDAEVPNLSFATQLGYSALRAALRQEPDVLMISELRDREAVSLATAAANRGVLVLAGSSARSPAEALGEIIDEYGVPSVTLAASFAGGLGARVARRVCPAKLNPYRPSRQEFTTLEQKGVDLVRVLNALKQAHTIDANAGWKDVPFFQTQVCSGCQGGYLGYIGIHERLPASVAVKQLLKENASAAELHQQARDEGVLSLAEDALYKAAQGLLSFEDAALAGDL